MLVNWTWGYSVIHSARMSRGSTSPAASTWRRRGKLSGLRRRERSSRVSTDGTQKKVVMARSDSHFTRRGSTAFSSSCTRCNVAPALKAQYRSKVELSKYSGAWLDNTSSLFRP